MKDVSLLKSENAWVRSQDWVAGKQL